MEVIKILPSCNQALGDARPWSAAPLLQRCTVHTCGCCKAAAVLRCVEEPVGFAMPFESPQQVLLPFPPTAACREEQFGDTELPQPYGLCAAATGTAWLGAEHPALVLQFFAES